MTHHRRQQRYMVEKRPKGIRIHDRRTRKHRDYYAAEFVYGCMDYCDSTAKYPNYVHAEVWRLVG